MLMTGSGRAARIHYLAGTYRLHEHDVVSGLELAARAVRAVE